VALVLLLLLLLLTEWQKVSEARWSRKTNGSEMTPGTNTTPLWLRLNDNDDAGGGSDCGGDCVAEEIEDEDEDEDEEDEEEGDEWPWNSSKTCGKATEGRAHGKEEEEESLVIVWGSEEGIAAAAAAAATFMALSQGSCVYSTSTFSSRSNMPPGTVTLRGDSTELVWSKKKKKKKKKKKEEKKRRRRRQSSQSVCCVGVAERAARRKESWDKRERETEKDRS
jgi:hypothetical protein